MTIRTSPIPLGLLALAIAGCAPATLNSAGDNDGGVGSDGSVITSDGSVITSDGSVITSDGSVITGDGSVVTGDGGRVMELAGPVGPINTDDVTPGPNPYGVQDYFVDCASGDDAHDGLTAATPWRTLAHFNSTASGMLVPGSRVFFKRGGVCHALGTAGRYSSAIWINPSGTADRNIEFRAYGEGEAPVISGAVLATGWTLESGSIYHTNIGADSPLKYVYIGDTPQTLARSPNKDAAGNTVWFATDDMNGNGDGTTFLTDSDLPTPASNNLVGATAFYRHDNWSFAEMEITAHSGNTITMSTPDSQCYTPHCPDSVYPAAGWGYIVENDRELLDHEGEYYYNRTTGELYFWAPGGVDPNTLPVELAVEYHAFFFADGHHDITVANLVLEKYRDAIVEAGDNPGTPGDAANNTIRNCEIRYGFLAIKNGTTSSDPSQGNNYLNNHIHDVYNAGIYNGGNGHLYRGNRIESIALQPELGGDRSLWAYFAFNNVSGGSTVSSNIFRNIGYTGINHIGGGEFSGNLIEDISIALNDGCAICTEPISGVLVRRNIVRGAHGNLDGVPLDFVNRHSITSGISTGDHSDVDGIIEENVVSDFANGGITLDNNFHSHHMTVRSNVVYTTQPGDGFGASGLQFMDQSVGVGGSCVRTGNGCYVANFEHEIYSNRVYMLNANTRSMNFVHLLTDGMGHSVDYGSFWDNYFFHAYRLDGVNERRTWGGAQVGDIVEIAPEAPSGASRTVTIRATASNSAAAVAMRASGDNGTALERMDLGDFVWWRVRFDATTSDPTMREGWVREYEMQLAMLTISQWQSRWNEPPSAHASTPNRSSGYTTPDPSRFPPIFVNDTGVPMNVTIGPGRCDHNHAPLPETVTLTNFADVIVPEMCADQPSP